MSNQPSGCNSLKPKKLPIETPTAPSSGNGYEPQMHGVEFGRRARSTRALVLGPSQCCNEGDVTAGKKSWEGVGVIEESEARVASLG
jgi:hypothetical protein